MHNINFTQSVTPKHQIAIRRWYQTTAILFSMLFLSIFAISAWQLYRLHRIRIEAGSLQKGGVPFSAILERKGQLEQEIAKIAKMADRIRLLTALNKQKLSFLSTLHKVCSAPLELKSARLQDEPEEIILLTPTIAAATTFIRDLRKESGIENLSITALESTGQLKNGILISIQRSIKNKENP